MSKSTLPPLEVLALGLPKMLALAINDHQRDYGGLLPQAVYLPPAAFRELKMIRRGGIWPPLEFDARLMNNTYMGVEVFVLMTCDNRPASIRTSFGTLVPL